MTHRFIEEHREVRELLAPYAMNSVNDDERARIERHLSDCPSCRDELGHHEQVVGALALSPLPVEPSPDVLSQLLAMPEIANGRQQGAAVPSAEQPEVASQPAAEAADLPVAAAASISHPPVRRVHQRARREFSWPRFAMPALAACCLALALVTGASLSKLSQVTNDRQSAIAAADDAKQQLRATRKSLDAPTVDVARRSDPVQVSGTLQSAHIEIARLENGKLVAVIRDMPDAADGRTWQVWRIDSQGKRISISTMQKGGRVVVLTVPKPGETRAFAITSEPAAGSKQPTTAPQAYGTLV